tara:strand:+ start:174 stop:1967 length:1794 start_codon:yes stop_codon:yes gene_type:complete
MTKLKNVPINYTSRDFETIKQDLVDHAKRYYPDTFKDFNNAGFGSLMLDTVAYVGDILSFYTDYQASEAFVDTASEFDNLVSLGKQTGFKLNRNPASQGIATFFIMVPADATGQAPDSRYIPILKKQTTMNSTSGARFILNEDVNFINGDTVVARVDSTTGEPTHFAIKNYGSVSSGELKTTSISVGAYEKFLEEFISDPNITQIISVVDSDGHEYYEVDYLTQNVIFRTIANRDEGTRDLTPEILKPMVVPRRFTTEQTSAGMKIQFGAGTEETNAEDRVLDPSSVAVKMYAKPYISDVEMDPSKLLSSDTMGVVPANTLLKITYLTNTKKDVNINANSLTTVSSPRMDFMDVASLDPAVVKSVRKSIESTNSEPITGATTGLNVEDLRRQVQNSFLNQRRAVTIRDYETLGYAMPPKFGALKRIRAIKNPNPRRGNLNMAVISVDSNDHLTTANAVLKDNLRTWLDKGRMVSDVIEITDAKILNFGINFNVIGDLDKERNVILQDCIDSLSDFYNNKPDIGEDFYITDIYKVLKDVEGVIDVVDVNITSKIGSNYSNISFDISDNISEDGRSIIMPRNAIYEIKYPNIDIKGAVR